MTPSRSRFVTACQQPLALAVVLAVLTPAASLVTLDVVGSAPAGTGSSMLSHPTMRTAAYTAEAVRASKVPTAPVTPIVHEVQLTSAVTRAGRSATSTPQARVVVRDGATRLTTTPQPVTGFGEVGLSWGSGVAVPQAAIKVAARTRTDGAWSAWHTIPYDPEHGPDPGSAEARHARPGTDPLLVGKVGSVQVRAVSRRPLPADMKLAVISPGRATHTATEHAAFDTSTMEGDNGADSVYRAVDPQPVSGDADSAQLAAAVFTPRPVIYSRAQWGADERMRSKSSLHYGDVHAGFVHHTVNANTYTRAEVPALLRSIYAYHVKVRGWSDIGYNYLIDRFGRIWEGRYGGIDRAVVGAHTLGFNDDSFAASAIGNYEVARPSQATLQAYATLFAWKLSLHGVDASSTRQYVTSRWFRAINGHRDAAATACPGQYLYDKLPVIRKMAAADQRGWSGRQLESNLASTPEPDLVVRRASDGEAFIIPTGGLIHFPAPTTVATRVTGATSVVVSRDLTGDKRGDLLVRQSDGSLAVQPGTPTGTYGATERVLTAFRGKDQVSAPGDLTGDGVPDLVARDRSGVLWMYGGNGHAGFAPRARVPGKFGSYATVTGGGDLTRDGNRDLLVRSRSTGETYVLPGRGDGTFAHRLGPFPRLTAAADPTIGAVAGNKAPDVAALVGTTVKVWVNPGTFDLGRPIDTGASFAGANRILGVGDWDRDGYGDVVTRQSGTGNLVLWRGDGRGHLQRAGVLARGFGSVSRLAAVGDMTGDGFPDLLGQPRKSVMMLYPGRGLPGLRKAYPAYGAIKDGSQLGVGRWNDDGAPD